MSPRWLKIISSHLHHFSDELLSLDGLNPRPWSTVNPLYFCSLLFAIGHSLLPPLAHLFQPMGINTFISPSFMQLPGCEWNAAVWILWFSVNLGGLRHGFGMWYFGCLVFVEYTVPPLCSSTHCKLKSQISDWPWMPVFGIQWTKTSNWRMFNFSSHFYLKGRADCRREMLIYNVERGLHCWMFFYIWILIGKEMGYSKAYVPLRLLWMVWRLINIV